MALPIKGSVTNSKTYQQVQGAVTQAGGGDTSVIAAQGAGTKIRLQKAVISMQVYNSSGFIALEDGAGGTVIWKGLVTTGNGASHVIDFGDNGLILSDNTALNLAVETDGTATCAAVGYVQTLY